MTALRYAFSPLLLLIVLAILASFISYSILQICGDVLPINKLISKTTLVLLLLSIFPLKRYLNLSWKDFGFAPWSRFFKQLQQGLILSLTSLMPVLISLYLLDVHIWDNAKVWTLSKLASKIGTALFFSLLIGVGEELLFRGLLISSLRRKLSIITTVIISSGYYAALHFLKTNNTPAFDQLKPDSGLQLVGQAFLNWLNPEIFSAFVALMVVGLFLAVIRTRVRHSLGLCIGCHAGWVWQIKLSKDLLNLNPDSSFLYLVSDYDGVVGPLVAIWLLLAMIVLIYFPNRKLGNS